ncbi:tRNA pseudouridine synthase A [Aulographum hederae CBS 113979]|uniref:tRNA pseudouridine synthase 1 n=1 Tax=Aulographum hederae CBS 113979 TaxID=1176131 RepID=A0A6G1HD35_9PEZI|nr:tRNA pseudouridine synthase A [Aulographum hederae CBS 113979]
MGQSDMPSPLPTGAPSKGPEQNERSQDGPSSPKRKRHDDEQSEQSGSPSKRREHFDNKPIKQGKGSKRRDLGRGEYFRNQPDKRKRNTEEQEKKRQRIAENGGKVESVLPAGFSAEEIAAEERKPKRKVAVMIGYSGSGYKGMQIMPTERTIEGDIFSAFVAAGAISKANADDPKKNALVRCARTDKGVHAAGNVISLKLIIEDGDIVEKINSHLSPQIRVWGIERTTGSFSCYQACDSRWYEYLIPTHCFLPPHPSSILGKKLVELAGEVGDLDGYMARQEEVKNYWAEVDENIIKPILESLDENIRERVYKALYESDTDPELPDSAGESAPIVEAAADMALDAKEETIESDTTAAASTSNDPEKGDDSTAPIDADEKEQKPQNPEKAALNAAIKQLKAAYMSAKRAYRIPASRQRRVQQALEAYVGTYNYHNYTIKKSATDPSAKRHIKSFKAAANPIIVGDTEWLSLKVHGQSFMMHQIRKMVGMAALVVRSGCPIERIKESFGRDALAIPKAPGLGLLLERPIFENYNKKQAKTFQRATIDFERYEKEMEEFKQREIYERIWKEEKEENMFHAFFAHIDNFREPHFLYLSSKGIAACPGRTTLQGKEKKGEKTKAAFDESSDDEDAAGAGEG